MSRTPIEWHELAAIDAAVTSEFFDTGEITTHKLPLVNPFESHTNLLDRPFYRVLRQSYVDALESVLFKPIPRAFKGDQHASYGCFAIRELPHQYVIPGLKGFLAEFPLATEDSEGCDFSVYTTGNVDLLMLGGLSFVNSSCVPNCVYKPNLKKFFVELQVNAENGVGLNDELTVFYGRNYFGRSNIECECPHKEHHGDAVVVLGGKTRSQTNKLRSIITEDLQDFPAQVELETADEGSDPSKQSYRSRVIESIQSHDKPSRKTRIHENSRSERRYTQYTKNVHRNVQYTKRAPIRCRLTSDSCSSSSDSEDENPCVSPSPESEEANVFEQQHDSLDEGRFDLGPASVANDLRCSTPHHNPRMDFFFDESEISRIMLDDNLSVNKSDSDISRGSDESIFELTNDADATEQLFPESTVSLQNFETCFQSMVTTYCLSDMCAKSFLSFFEKTLPPGNKCKKVKKALFSQSSLQDLYERHDIDEGNTFFSLSLKFQLTNILLKHYDKIIEYQKRRKHNLLTVDDIPIDFNFDSGDVHLHLIINSDGVPLMKSRNLSIWPIWVAIAELPPIVRSSFANVALLGLWSGTAGKPKWDVVCEKLGGQLESLRVLGLEDDNLPKKVFFQPLLLICDMPAKASLLRMKQFNGYFG